MRIYQQTRGVIWQSFHQVVMASTTRLCRIFERVQRIIDSRLLLIRFWILWLGASGEHQRLHGVTWSPLPSLILIGCVCLQWLGCVERFWLTIREWLTVCELENGGKWSFTDGLSMKHADSLICHNYLSLPEGRRVWKCLLSSPVGSSTLIARSAISRCRDLYKSCPRILSLRHVATQGMLTPPSGGFLIDTAGDPFLKCGIESNLEWIGYIYIYAYVNRYIYIYG